MEIFNVKISKLRLEADNNVGGDIFIAKPEKDLANRLGTLFGLVELTDLPEIFAEHFLDILNDLKTEYYLPPIEMEYGVEKRFEGCLSRANRRLAHALQDSVENIELEKISALTGLIYKNKLYLSRLGKNEAMLYHQKKSYGQLIIDIFAQASDKKTRTNPEKMFSNIVSGEITNKDNIILANQKVFQYISPLEMSEIIINNPPAAVAGEINEILKTQSSGANNFYLILIQPDSWASAGETWGTTTAVGQDRSSQPPENSLKKLLSTQKKTEEYLAPSMMPNWKKALIILGRFIKQAAVYLAKLIYRSGKVLLLTIGRLIKRNIRAIIRIIRNKTGRGQSKQQPIKDYFKTPAQETAASQLATTDEPTEKNQDWPEGLSREEKNVKKFKTPAKKNRPAIRPLNSIGTATSRGETINTWLNGKIIQFIKLTTGQKVMLVAGLIALFFFSQSIVIMGRALEDKSSVINAPQIAQDVEDKINAAEAQNVFNDEAGALQALTEAKNLLATLPDKNKYRQIKADLTQRITALSNELLKVTYLDQPTVAIDLTKINPTIRAGGLAIIGSNAFTFSDSDKKLYQIDLTSGSGASNSLPAIGAARKILALNDQNLLILNGDQEIYQYNLDTKTGQTILKATEKIDDFAVYENKVYTLKTSKNQIYRHIFSGEKLNSGTAWIKDNSDVKDGRAIAVEGGLILIKNSDEIKYFTAGKAQTTAWPKLNPALNATAILSNQSSNYFFVLDSANQRVVAEDKKGEVKQQFTAKEFKNLNSFALVEKDKKIYLLADNKIYLVNFNF